MKGSSTQNINSAIEAWEQYCSGKYEKLIRDFGHLASEEDEIHDLLFLSRLELSTTADDTKAPKSVFSALVHGMRAHHNGQHKDAAKHLASFLLEKNYYNVHILTSFFKSARLGEEYRQMHAVAKKYIEKPNCISASAEPLFTSSFYLSRHKEALQIFETYREHFKDKNILQKVAFCMLNTGKYKDAERILVSLHEKITGVRYQLEYDTVKAKYAPVMGQIPDLEKKENRSFQDSMQLGMAYLFSERYEEALVVFQGLSNNDRRMLEAV